ncbi:MAG: hypothetical protein KDD33_13595 [Bdellovibrionales bacterium]|nr:hypothetical protein [Bdellovibrionales bacterium]
MNRLKVLVLVHESCVPPKGATVKQADWAIWKTEFYVIRALKKLGHEVRVLGVYGELDPIKWHIESHKPDIVFNLLEEFQGLPSFESHIVSFLELMGIPYTGCNPQGLSIGRDKALAKKILNYHDIATPQFCVVRKGQKASLNNLRFPVIVKSLVEEASMGISQSSVVTSLEKLQERVQFIHENIQTDAIIEEYVDGRELYVSVLGHNRLKVLPPWELFFGDLGEQGKAIATWNVKFSKSYCEKHGITRGAAKLDEFTMKRISKLCKTAYIALKFSGYARMDIRLTSQGKIYFIEANPNAELAKGECMANAARHKGQSYDKLIKEILSLALFNKKAA